MTGRREGSNGGKNKSNKYFSYLPLFLLTKVKRKGRREDGRKGSKQGEKRGR